MGRNWRKYKIMEKSLLVFDNSDFKSYEQIPVVSVIRHRNVWKWMYYYFIKEQNIGGIAKSN